ncbi:hypothetical protein ACFQVD_26820 [Streptosporangium amethystogenes subsp. fukuiense]|uniref:Uncharacterized protein n=1 Tax=Streptosporangium amethystogenes subsp. fukuiense TaxID=698418 RepID=A0ABW2T5J3_9ACTN
MSRLEAFLAALLTVVLPAPKGRRHRPPVKASTPAAVLDTAPIPALTRNPYPQENNR